MSKHIVERVLSKFPVFYAGAIATVHAFSIYKTAPLFMNFFPEHNSNHEQANSKAIKLMGNIALDAYAAQSQTDE